MAITKRPKIKDEQQAVNFIDSAPDGNLNPTETNKRGRPQNNVKRIAISHTITPLLLEKLDQRAEELGMPRASLINLAIAEFLNKPR